VWAFEVSALGPPRTGEFVSTVLSAAGTPTAGELKNELQRECTGGPPGTNIVGTCTTTIDALGWTTPPGMTVTEYFGNLYHSDAGNPTQNGATLVGYGGWSGYTSVAGALDALKSTAAAEGGYLVGYNGWGIADATVSGALQRLNDAATSPTDSGATHVKFWDTNPLVPVSKSVQEGLNELYSLSAPIILQVTLPFGSLAVVNVGTLPPSAIANGYRAVQRIVLSVRAIPDPGSPGLPDNDFYSVELSPDISGVGNFVGTTRIGHVWLNVVGTWTAMQFIINAAGLITVQKLLATFPNDWEIKATAYLNTEV